MLIPLSAVIVIEIMLALVNGCTTLINRRWKFFIDRGVKQGEGAFLMIGGGTGTPPTASPSPSAAAAAATVAAVV